MNLPWAGATLLALVLCWVCAWRSTSTRGAPAKLFGAVAVLLIVFAVFSAVMQPTLTMRDQLSKSHLSHIFKKNVIAVDTSAVIGMSDEVSVPGTAEIDGHYVDCDFKAVKYEYVGYNFMVFGKPYKVTMTCNGKKIPDFRGR